MTAFPTVRVAAIQATPVILDAQGSVDKAVSLLEEAAGQGAQLAVLPETFISIYPGNVWAKNAPAFSGWDELWERMWESSVDVPGPLVDQLVEACRRLDIHCAIGVNERESARPGSLYNALLILGPDGLISRHRKLMPTMQERIFHGIGAGDDMDVAELPIGRVGGLICWENRMPLARYAVYQGGPQIWVAPTADDTDGWLATVRHIAIESGAFVVSVPAVHPGLRVPGRLPDPAAGGQGRIRRRRSGDHRADLGQRDRRPAARRGGHPRGRLRPAPGPSREAMVRRGGPLRQGGRAGPRAEPRPVDGRAADQTHADGAPEPSRHS